jgi:hypothetical protein
VAQREHSPVHGVSSQTNLDLSQATLCLKPSGGGWTPPRILSGVICCECSKQTTITPLIARTACERPVYRVGVLGQPHHVVGYHADLGADLVQSPLYSNWFQSPQFCSPSPTQASSLFTDISIFADFFSGSCSLGSRY